MKEHGARETLAMLKKIMSGMMDQEKKGLKLMLIVLGKKKALVLHPFHKKEKEEYSWVIFY